MSSPLHTTVLCAAGNHLQQRLWQGCHATLVLALPGKPQAATAQRIRSVKWMLPPWMVRAAHIPASLQGGYAAQWKTQWTNQSSSVMLSSCQSAPSTTAAPSCQGDQLLLLLLHESNKLWLGLLFAQLGTAKFRAKATGGRTVARCFAGPCRRFH